MNKVLNKNERILEQAISKDIVNIVVTSTVDNAYEPVHECERCAKLKTELQKDFIKRESYDKLFKQYTTLEKHCISLEVVQIVLWYLDSGCSKHMTEDRSQLTNFVNKFLGMVKFGNDHMAKIMGYGDYKIGNVTISRQGLVRGLPKLKFEMNHLCSACAMGKIKCLRSKDEAPDFIINFLKMIQIGVSHETSVACSPQQNGVVERRNRTLIEATRTISGPALHEMTPATISSGLVPKPTSSTLFVPPSRNDWDMLFQPLFNKLLAPPPSVDPPAPAVIASIAKVIAPIPAESTDSPSSTTVDQDAPSPSKSQTTPETQPPIISNNVEEDNHDIEVAHMGNDPKWTKDHPLENIISQLARPVSTRLQLHEQALFCYYDAFHTSVQPKTYKDALTQSCWIESMQEELNEFECLKVWKLVPWPDKVMVITLKWIYKVKLDELGGSVDPTLFIHRNDNDLLLISQSPRGIFINHSKYALESLKGYDIESYDLVDTPMVEKSKLDEDKKGKPLIRHIIVARPIEKHLHAVKRIFRYLRGIVNRGQWYPKDSSITLTAFAYVDHAGCQDTHRSTSGSQ
nr:hypothetical protein [Tanacetum cinerariifolium]